MQFCFVVETCCVSAVSSHKLCNCLPPLWRSHSGRLSSVIVNHGTAKELYVESLHSERPIHEVEMGGSGRERLGVSAHLPLPPRWEVSLCLSSRGQTLALAGTRRPVWCNLKSRASARLATSPLNSPLRWAFCSAEGVLTPLQVTTYSTHVVHSVNLL